MQNKLYIPEKIRVGFRERSDTYTGKLAYVIYYDEKGKIRKEASFDGWRDESIDVLELDNNPRNGYLFNKGVKRHAYNFGSGRTMLRVYDPRDFEFEIDIDNLEAILVNSDISKKEIMGDFVFAWHGKDLILLPINSQEYRDSVEYTEKQYKKVSTKELIKGGTYSQKKNDNEYIYVGFFEFNEMKYSYAWSNKVIINKGKKHIFFNRKHEMFEPVSLSTFSECKNNEPVEDYAEIIKAYEDSYHSQESLGFTLGDIKKIFTKGNEKSGELMKKINETQYVHLDFMKKAIYRIKEEKHFGRDEYVFTFSLYEKNRKIFQYVPMENESNHGYGRGHIETEYHKFQNKMAQELFGESDEILPKDLKETLEKAGYKRVCTERKDGKLFYIDSRYQ